MLQQYKALPENCIPHYVFAYTYSHSLHKKPFLLSSDRDGEYNLRTFGFFWSSIFSQECKHSHLNSEERMTVMVMAELRKDTMKKIWFKIFISPMYI